MEPSVVSICLLQRCRVRSVFVPKTCCGCHPCMYVHSSREEYLYVRQPGGLTYVNADSSRQDDRYVHAYSGNWWHGGSVNDQFHAAIDQPFTALADLRPLHVSVIIPSSGAFLPYYYCVVRHKSCATSQVSAPLGRRAPSTSTSGPPATSWTPTLTSCSMSTKSPPTPRQEPDPAPDRGP